MTKGIDKTIRLIEQILSYDAAAARTELALLRGNLNRYPDLLQEYEDYLCDLENRVFGGRSNRANWEGRHVYDEITIKAIEDTECYAPADINNRGL